MSNYKSELQLNNTDLQTILSTINGLPSGSGGEQATPTITVNNSTGLITATAGTKSATKQLAFQAAKTITPTTTSQIAVSSGYYTGGNVTVAAIPSTYIKPSYTKTATTYTPTTTNQTISAGTYCSGAQTIKGDSNLTAGNIKSGVSIFGVNGTYVGSGGSGGDTSVEDGLIDGTLTVCENNRVTHIKAYAFYSCSTLTSVNFPSVTGIGYSAFQSCSALTSISFPKVTIIAEYAFQGCKSLTSVYFPQATNIGKCAFQSCTSLTSVYFPKAYGTGNNAFQYCSALTSVSFPLATSIYSYAFQYCTALTSVSFPKVTDISASVFQGCTSLTSVYLTNSQVCTLRLSNAFSNTGIWSDKGSIFVPASLVNSYKAATNWAFFSNRIFSIT